MAILVGSWAESLAAQTLFLVTSQRHRLTLVTAPLAPIRLTSLRTWGEGGIPAQTCPSGSLGNTKGCEWKPSSILIVGCAVIPSCTGGIDLFLYGASRQYETGGYGQVYSSLLGSTSVSISGGAYSPLWTVWQGLPNSVGGGGPNYKNGEITNATFGASLNFANAGFTQAKYALPLFIQYGEAYANATGQAATDGQSSYIFALLTYYGQQVANTGVNSMIAVRLPLSCIVGHDDRNIHRPHCGSHRNK